MNNEFTYYKVEWLEKDITGFYKRLKIKKYYTKREAFDFKYFVEKSDIASNCLVKKITEITEVIA
ncbi:hypothetical protein MX081_10395 [Streptococcus uberis]|uniref:hypothetical protein n=1 Tax=Streptococcus uberis TaxID=1349 RepID=UPI0027DC2A98|nr:hypothetical protein [Streptococcus uberis]MCK1254441.1 hypothetical protein [Streptococcus uberis]